MRIKPTPKTGGVVVELGPNESQFPTDSGENLAVPLQVFRLTKILVPVDFSECSKKALLYAIPFAKQFGAELILLNVVPRYPSVPEMAPVDVESIQDGRRDLETLRKAIGDQVPSTTTLRTGTPHIEIVEAAREFDADLIILSTHGRKGLAHVVLGSTTERVTRYAPCPVLVVREHQHEFVPVRTTATQPNEDEEVL